MRNYVFMFALALGAITASAEVDAAEPVACPNLVSASQVGNCPTDAELRYAFAGYCADDRRIYDRDPITCASIEVFKKLKNTALWETKDGVFQGYVSCLLKPEQVAAAKANGVRVKPEGKIHRLICEYENDIVFVRRSRAPCTVIGNAECGPDPASCKATCE